MSEKTPTQRRKESDDYGPGTPCSQCGDKMDEYTPEWAEYCLRHVGKRAHPVKMDLQELIDSWIEESNNHSWDEYTGGIHDAREACAQELVEVLEYHD